MVFHQPLPYTEFYHSWLILNTEFLKGISFLSLIPFIQARSQACVSGVAKLSRRNHMLQSVIATQFIMCEQENIEICSLSQGSRWSLCIASGDISSATKIKQQYEKCKTISRGCKKLACCCPECICHPMPAPCLRPCL